MAIFREVTPEVEPLSLDEAFLDVTGAVRRLGSPREIADALRTRIREAEHLPCSIGVASTKFVAKLASARAKPDGLLVIPRESTLAFLHPLPIGALWGVGDKTEAALTQIGLQTIGATPVTTLVHTVGKAAGAHLHALANGQDPRRVVPDEPDRSIGAEETFGSDIADAEGILRELLRLSERCAERARASNVVGRTVAIKVRFSDFRTVSRSRTLVEPTDVARTIYETASRLYDSLDIAGTPLRLVGVRIESLARAEEVPEQLSLSGDDEEWRAAEQAVDRVSAKFGRGSIRPAALVRRPEEPV
jgi:DNA polymerase-4